MFGSFGIVTHLEMIFGLLLCNTPSRVGVVVIIIVVLFAL